jgi:hypothetical protein
VICAVIFTAPAAALPSPTPTTNPIDQPPPGITPTKITKTQVLQRYRASIGSRSVKTQTRIETDAVTAYGLTGTYKEVESGDDYVESQSLGPVLVSNGKFHGQRWRYDENGYTRIVSGVNQENLISSRTVQQSILGESTKFVTLIGQVQSPLQAYVVEVHPPGGRHEWLFFDKATGQLDREELAMVDRRVVLTYDDFRATNGLQSPWHQHRSDGYAANEMDYRVTSLEYGTAIKSSDLAIPMSKAKVEFPTVAQSVRLPARFSFGDIIIRVTIAGRGLDFALDSGAGSIVIDRDVAKSLGLQTYGESTLSVAGTFEQSTAIVPAMHIGDLTMHDVFVHSLPFHYQRDQKTKIVGLLGYDFLAGIVAK